MLMIIFFSDREESESVSESQLSRATHSCEVEGGTGHNVNSLLNDNNMEDIANLSPCLP